MLVTSHNNGTIPGTIPGTRKESVRKCSNNLLILNMHMPEKYFLHDLYNPYLTIITIISITEI